MRQNLMLFLRLFGLRFQENKLSVHAGYLTYSTLLALVPLVMVVFSIFSAFPIFTEVAEMVKQFIYDNFAPNAGEIVQEYLDSFIHNSRQMSSVGLVSLIAVALLLVHSIDKTLNEMWHNTQKRSPFISFAIYWLILTLGPILAGCSVVISSSLLSSELFSAEGTFSFGHKLLTFAPFGFTWLMFTLIYTLVPNTKVLFRHALIGALLAAIFFTLGKQIFVWYIITFPSYQAIYGTLATLPIMIVWIHLSWLVILLGAQCAAVFKDMSLIKQEKLSLPKPNEEIK